MNTIQYAGGCFWCVEHDLREAPGVEEVISGYAGGDATTANYHAVSSHATNHREVVEVHYDPTQTTFKKLTQYFLDHIDPTDDGGQFGDRGENYKTAIYYQTEEEKAIAEALLNELEESEVYGDAEIVVDILPASTFYPAEEYHQNYAEKNPTHYNLYRQGSGRAGFINKTCQIREQKQINWKD